jgi:hypothetical protein
MLRNFYQSQLAGSIVSTSDPLLATVEDLSWNLGTALLCIRDDKLDSAIFHLEREKARRERAPAC